MSKIRVFSPELVKAARGTRSRAEIAVAGLNRFTEQDLYNYEKGNNLPPLNKLSYLLLALGVTYADISVAAEAAEAGN